MWTILVRFILRNRLGNLIVLLALTVFMGYKASKVEMSYEFSQVLPSTDSTSVTYKEFKEVFGEDGSVLFIGIQDEKIKNYEVFKDWYNLTYGVKAIDGVKDVVSIARAFHLVKNNELEKFEFKPIFIKEPEAQNETDSILNLVLSYPFYEGFLYNSKTYATIMALTIDKEKIDSKSRFQLIDDITKAC